MKYRFNEEKFLRNMVGLSTVISAGIVVYKIATCGISFISTIGYFG
jgi:hypothetical protein